MANFTEIIVLLDRSGSMQSIKAAMESGFTEFLNAHKATPTTRISLIQFDSGNPYEAVYIARPVTDVPALAIEPRGMTPLLDAFCRVIDETGRRFAAMQAGDRPNNVLFVIITDGEENASRAFTRADVKQRVEHQRDKYNWQFVYLGANQDAIKEALTFGIARDYAISYTASVGDTVYKMRGLANNTASFAASGDADTIRWFDAQRIDATDNPDLQKLTNTPLVQGTIPFPEPEPTGN